MNKNNILSNHMLPRLVFTGFSALFLLAGWTLSLDTLEMYRNPSILLSCDISDKISCTEVAKTWQANLVNWFGIQAPNAFFVIGAGAVFVTIGVAIIAGTRFPKLFMVAAHAGTIFGVIFAYWLLYQSMFVIAVLCPWCLVMMISMTFCFMSMTRYNVYSDNLPFKKQTCDKLKEFCDNKLDLIIYAGWIVIIIALILIVEHSAFGF